jgi:GMP synthase PP-ATPase subunit
VRERQFPAGDFTRARGPRFDHAFLGRVARCIINEVRGINRATYDITSKLPVTIERE